MSSATNRDSGAARWLRERMTVVLNASFYPSSTRHRIGICVRWLSAFPLIRAWLTQRS